MIKVQCPMSHNARSVADLGPRQERFVEEYLVRPLLLSTVKAQRVIAARMAERLEGTEVAADRALLEVARLAFSDLRRLFHKDGRLEHPNEWADDTAAAIASVEIVTRKRADGEVEHV